MFEGSSDGSGLLPQKIQNHFEQAKEVELTKREDTFISRVKILVAVVLLIAVSAVATVAFLLVTQQEKQSFENQVSLWTRLKSKRYYDYADC